MRAFGGFSNETARTGGDDPLPRTTADRPQGRHANPARAALLFWSLRVSRDPQEEGHLQRRRRKKSRTAGRKPAESKWRRKRPASETLDFHPLQLFRPGRICDLFDVDRSTFVRWRRQGVLPPFIKIGGIEGLTGEQLQRFLTQRAEADHGDPARAATSVPAEQTELQRLQEAKRRALALADTRSKENAELRAEIARLTHQRGEGD
jgi:hypothetical protein